MFGSPTYVVAGDMFYGQDHLELVARAQDEGDAVFIQAENLAVVGPDSLEHAVAGSEHRRLGNFGLIEFFCRTLLANHLQIIAEGI